jgi:hypothetical protein
MAPSATTSAGIGAVLLVAGAVIFGGSDPQQYCGLSGCTERPDYLTINTGASLMGAGAGFLVTGALGLAGWSARSPEGTETRRSPPLMVTGFSAIALGTAGIGLGVAQAETYSRFDDYSTAVPLLITSGLLTVAGIPMLAIGSRIDSASDRAAMQARDAAARSAGVRSMPRLIWGIVLCGIALEHGLAGAAITGIDVSNGYGGVAAIVGAPLLAASGILASVGIPLVVTGAARNAPDGAPAGVPTVRASGLGATAGWELP